MPGMRWLFSVTLAVFPSSIKTASETHGLDGTVPCVVRTFLSACAERWGATLQKYSLRANNTLIHIINQNK